MSMRAVQVREFGGPEVLVPEVIAGPTAGAGEVVVRNAAIGLNFLDVYYRSGRYSTSLPFVPGHEAAAVVHEVGPGVRGVAVGDHVGYIDQMGAYAEQTIVAADRLIPLPPQIDSAQAAGMLLKGMTAEYLVRRTYPVSAGETILIHAAAGGVGQILCQWAKQLGATVIGSVGSAAKQTIARSAGCDHVVVTDEEDVVTTVRHLTGGRGVPVVFDGVGRATFDHSLDCLAPRGMVVAFGAASGPIPPLDVQSLGPRGSLYVTRPMIGPYVASATDLRASAEALFDLVLSGRIKVDVARTYPLADAARAHADLEARRLSGSTVLLP